MINWSSAKTLDIAIRKIKTDTSKFIGARFAPVVPRVAQVIEYDEIHGAMGMTTAHTLDSDPRMIAYPQVVRKSFDPGYFKEMIRLNESDLLKLRQLGGTEYQSMRVQEIIGEGLASLNTRIESRLEWLRWTALLTGQVAIDENNVKFTAAYGVPGGNLTKTVGVSWASGSSAKPVEDLLTRQQDFIGSGYGLKYIVMNSYTAGLFTKATDTKGYSGAGIKEKLMPGNLSQWGPVFIPGSEWVIYDGGYTNDSGTFAKFIPDNKVVLLGDAPVGEIIDIVTVPSLHSVSGQPTPGKFAYIIDKTGQKVLNPRVDMVGGIYCLPRIRRPEALFVMDVTST